MPHSMERLVQYLREVDKLKKTRDLIRGGLVIYADDQFINQKGMTLTMRDIGFDERLASFSTGLKVVEYFEKLLSELLAETSPDVRRIT